MKKLLILIFTLLLVGCFGLSVAAESPNLIDEADILSETEEKSIESNIKDYISKTGYDIVIYLTENNEYYNRYGMNEAITRLADDTFDNNGYGKGSEKDGLIMVIDVGVRDYTITTHGFSCIDTYTDRALEDMYDSITTYLADNDWAGGAETFISEAERVYDSYDYYHQKANPVTAALTPALLGALIITLISFLSLRRQLKNMAVGTTAENYMEKQNINLTRSGDIYLYTNVSRVKIEKEPEHSSGSTTHISSSGESHGGGGSHRF